MNPAGTKRMSRPLSLLAAFPLVLALLAGCASGSAPAPGTTGPATTTHTVTHEFGTTEVPNAPTAVVALDEQAAMSALAVGITPSVVYTTWGYQVAQKVLADRGTRVVRAAIGGPPPTETVLAEKPDLVLFTSVGDPAPFTQLSSTIPTVPLPATTTSWRDTVTQLGVLFDRPEQATKVIAALDAQVTRAKATADGQSVSILMNYGGTLATSAPESLAGVLLSEAGFRTPVLPAGAAPPPGMAFVPLSPEQVPALDADVTAVFADGVYDAAAVTGLPTFAQLRSARAGRTPTVVGEMWLATDPFSAYWILGDLAAIGAAAPVGTLDDGVSRYAAFADATT